MEQSLHQLSFGYIPAQIIYTAAVIGVGDALAAGPADGPALAVRTGADPAALLTFLRAMVGLGLLRQEATGEFALTAIGSGLRSDTPDSARDDILMSVMPELWQAWGELPRVLRTGLPLRDPTTGDTAHQRVMGDVDLAARYRAAKAIASGEFTASLVCAVDFGQFATITDLGGGDNGAVMAAVLASAPSARGLIVDVPAAAAAVQATLEAAGLADRCRFAAGESDAAIEAGADAYLLNHVVRERTDEQAAVLLRACREAVGERARLILLETVIPDRLGPDHSALFGLTELNNLVYTGGRERTADEYRALLAKAGLSVVGMTSLPAVEGLPDYHVIEARPV